MREPGKVEAPRQEAAPTREAPEEAYRKALPPEFVSVVGQADPAIVGMLLRNHPQLSTPLMTAINQLRGHGFAQLAIAAASSHPMHKPEPRSGETAQPPMPRAPAAVEPPAPQGDPKLREARAVAGWNQLANAIPSEVATPEHVRIPDNIVKELDRAWAESLQAKPEREMGGNLVKDGRDYAVRRYGGDADGETFQGDDSNVGWRQSLVGRVHTHPYGDYKDKGVPEQFASFSEQDFDAFMRSEGHLSLLRSGPFTFMLSKTQQFLKLVDATDNDEAKLSELSRRMYATYDAVFNSMKGSFSERVEAGVLAVCNAFHLVYYEGQGGELTRRTQRPKP